MTQNLAFGRISILTVTIASICITPHVEVRSDRRGERYRRKTYHARNAEFSPPARRKGGDMALNHVAVDRGNIL